MTLWELDADFTRKMIRDIVCEELSSLLGGTGGYLGEERAKSIAALAGCSVRHVYRLRQEVLAANEEEELDLIESLARHGRKGFVMDDVFWTLYYWLDGRASRVLAALTAAGFDVPSAATVSRKMRHAPPALVDGGRHGLKNRGSKFLYTHLDDAEVDEVWEGDEVIVDLDIAGPFDTGRMKLHGQLIIDRASMFKRAAVALPNPFTAQDWMAVVGAACEPLVDHETGEIYGSVAETIVLDNAKAFIATCHDETWARMATLGAPTPGLLVPVPNRVTHAPYWPNGKPYVEGGVRDVQDEMVNGQAGRLTRAERLDGSDAHSQPVSALMGWDTAVGLWLRAVERLNHRFVPKLDATPAEFYMANSKPRRVLPDAALAELYQPHWHLDGERLVSGKGVSIDGERWTGEGLDGDFDRDWRKGTGPRPAQNGDTVEVRVLHHHADPAYYLPKRDQTGRIIPVDRSEPVPFGRRRDRAAIMFQGHFTGWVYPGPTPAATRERIVLNRVATLKYISRLTKNSRSAARLFTQHTELVGDADIAAMAGIAQQVSEAVDDPGGQGGGEPAAVGQDAKDAGDEKRPGRRPATRSGARTGGKPRAAKPKTRPGLETLADALDREGEREHD